MDWEWGVCAASITNRGRNVIMSTSGRLSMFSVSAELYEAIYSFKDYATESSKIHQRIERERPGAQSILDVACGTAEHAKHLSAHFRIDGIDLEPKFIEIARAKNLAGNYSVADMRSFQLAKR